MTKANLKPANAKARGLFAKLTALAERGINGERAAAQIKLDRLKTRFDFSAPDPDCAKDIFADVKASRANFGHPRTVFQAPPADSDIANAVKWSFEHGAGVQCVWRAGELIADANDNYASKLAALGQTVADSFRALWGKFSQSPGIVPGDRNCFILSLYDGMMNEHRNAGQPLPARGQTAPARNGRSGRKNAVMASPGLQVHPYSVAVQLGRGVRFAAPLDTLAGQIESLIRGEIPQANVN